MRAGSISARGGAAALAPSQARPHAVDRVVDAIAGFFGGSTVNFAPVDGVFRAETNPDAKGATGLVQTQRVQATREDAPIRLYNARAREIYMAAPVLGSMIDQRA